MKSICTIVLLTAAAALSAADARSGEAVFTKSCRVCHGARGEGNAAVAKALKIAIPDLRSKEIQARSDDEVAKTILEGKGKMKPVQAVSASAARDVVQYVRTLAAK